MWQRDLLLDPGFDVSGLDQLPEALRAVLNTYGYTQMQAGRLVVILCGDNARFMNHSLCPNLVEAGQENEFNVAVRDIAVDEELTCDYRSFDLEADRRLAAWS